MCNRVVLDLIGHTFSRTGAYVGCRYVDIGPTSYVTLWGARLNLTLSDQALLNTLHLKRGRLGHHETRGTMEQCPKWQIRLDLC